MKIIKKWLNKRKLSKLKAAFSTVEAEGFTVCRIQHVAGTDYILDSTGAWRKIGKRA